VEKSGRPGEVEALAVIHAESAEQCQVLVARDPLGDDRRTDSVGEVDE
jgi:hypothetical protein